MGPLTFMSEAQNQQTEAPATEQATQKERGTRYEALPPEMLEILQKELEAFKASFPADKPVTKNGLKCGYCGILFCLEESST